MTADVLSEYLHHSKILNIKIYYYNIFIIIFETNMSIQQYDWNRVKTKSEYTLPSYGAYVYLVLDFGKNDNKWNFILTGKVNFLALFKIILN